MSTVASDAMAAHLWSRRCALVYRARLSVLYHAKRAGFYDAADRWATALTTVSATAAVAVIVKGWPGVETAMGACTAALSLVPLLWGPAQRGFKHAELSANFRRLLGQMEGSGEHWTIAQCDSFAAAFAELEAVEPAPLNALMADCQNQLTLSFPREDRAPLIELGCWARWTKHWFDFDPVRIASRS